MSLKSVYIDAGAREVVELIEMFGLKANKNKIESKVVDHYNSIIDSFLASNQTGYYQAKIDLFVDNAVCQEMCQLNADFYDYAELRLGDVVLYANLYPNNSAQFSYELHVVYNIGSSSEDVIVVLNVEMDNEFSVTRTKMRYESSNEAGKYLTYWLLKSCAS